MSQALTMSIRHMLNTNAPKAFSGNEFNDHEDGLNNVLRNTSFDADLSGKFTALISWGVIDYEDSPVAPPAVLNRMAALRPFAYGVFVGHDGMSNSEANVFAHNMVFNADKNGMKYDIDTWSLMTTDSVAELIGDIAAMAHESMVLRDKEPNLRKALEVIAGRAPQNELKLDLRDQIMMRVESKLTAPTTYHPTDFFVYPCPITKPWAFPKHFHNDKFQQEFYKGIPASSGVPAKNYIASMASAAKVSGAKSWSEQAWLKFKKYNTSDLAMLEEEVLRQMKALRDELDRSTAAAAQQYQPPDKYKKMFKD